MGVESNEYQIPYLFIQDDEPTDLTVGKLWYKTSTGVLYSCDGAVWVDILAGINLTEIEGDIDDLETAMTTANANIVTLQAQVGNVIPFTYHHIVVTGDIYGEILCHSPTVWTKLNGVTSKRTTDAGVTWGAVTTDFAGMTYGTLCKADKTYAIGFLATNICFTINSGDVWTEATSEPNDNILCIDYPTTSVA